MALLPSWLPASISRPDADELNYEMTSRWGRSRPTVALVAFGLWFGDREERRGEKRAINLEGKD